MVGLGPDAGAGLYVVVSIMSVAFPGILIYLLLWIIMPPPE